MKFLCNPVINLQVRNTFKNLQTKIKIFTKNGLDTVENVNMKFQSHPVLHFQVTINNKNLQNNKKIQPEIGSNKFKVPTPINCAICVIEIRSLTENGCETVANVLKNVIKKIQPNPATYSQTSTYKNFNQKLQWNLKNV